MGQIGQKNHADIGEKKIELTVTKRFVLEDISITLIRLGYCVRIFETNSFCYLSNSETTTNTQLNITSLHYKLSALQFFLQYVNIEFFALCLLVSLLCSMSHWSRMLSISFSFLWLRSCPKYWPREKLIFIMTIGCEILRHLSWVEDSEQAEGFLLKISKPWLQISHHFRQKCVRLLIKYVTWMW